MSRTASVGIINSPLTLPCGLTSQYFSEVSLASTCAEPPNFEPPVAKSVASTVPGPTFAMACFSLARWKEWARIAQIGGTPCVVKISHPGRTSIVGAGIGPVHIAPLCPSRVPPRVGDTWLDKVVVVKLLATPKAIDLFWSQNT
ncbi:hypothetical protein PV04_07581 [Phialophora macrospora]|uniref:Uncharacterized protein n=1 Tax=Phialophora macrospora TaxID=1851006 RepID=A0A0D2FEK3_9EURO|nr:hypothetical protein PV04_07581 [Phialophora macrospora]